MRFRFRRGAAVRVLASAVILALTGAIPASVISAEDALPGPQATSGDAMIPAGTGAICIAAILETLSAYGKRCVSDEDPAFRARLDDSLRRFYDHFAARGGWTPEMLARFRAQMGGTEPSERRGCANPDEAEMYRGFKSIAPDEFHRMTTELISRAGPPEWGDCL